MPSVEVRVLGLPSLRVDGEERRTPRKVLALLCVLALDGPATRGALSALLWERERHLARQSLRNAALALRRALTPHAPLQASADRLWLEPGGVWLDAAQLAHAPEEELPGLWRGPLLDGLDVADSAAWDDWLADREEALAGTYLSRCLALGIRALERGNLPCAAALAGAALRAVPDSPQAAGLLVRAQRAMGQGALAQLTATQFRRRFRAQYGEDPEWSGEPPSLAPRPGASVLASAPGPTDLPRPLTRFIGRDLERQAVLEALREGRLVTLHGPAGVGKTRLALEVARDLADGWPDLRVHFVPLDDLREPGAVPARIAQVVGAALGQDLAAVLGHTATLLVLDNAEHLLAAADDWPRLLTACPGLRLLVTSREVLHLRPEQVVTLGGLEVPGPGCSPEQTRQAEAVRFFEDRMRAAGAPFAWESDRLDTATLDDMRRVCDLLGGTPLGIELAAAWTRSQTLPELRRRLEAAVLDLSSPYRDARARHRSLRAALEHSWALLPPQAREDFSGLGVFPASFDSGAARAILDASPSRLAALVDRSLLRRDAAGRYHAHSLVRAFAREKLGLDSLRQRRLADRHTAFYAAQLHTLNTSAGGAASPDLLAFLQVEESNVTVLMGSLLHSRRYDQVASLAEPLMWLFPLFFRMPEGLTFYRDMLGRLPEDGPAAAHARLAFAASYGLMHLMIGHVGGAVRLLAEAVQGAGAAHDALQYGRALDGLGQAHYRAGQFAQATPPLHRAVDSVRSLGDSVRLLRVLNNAALAVALTDGHTQAEVLHREAQDLHLGGAVPEGLDVVWLHTHHGLLRMLREDPAGALQAWDQTILVARNVNTPGLIPVVQALRSLVLLDRGLEHGEAADVLLAGQVCAETLPITEVSGEQFAQTLIHILQGCLQAHAGEGEAGWHRARQGVWLAYQTQNGLVVHLALPFLIHLLVAAGNLHLAGLLIGYVRQGPDSTAWQRRRANRVWDHLRQRQATPEADALAGAVRQGGKLDLSQLMALFWTDGEVGPVPSS